MANDPRDADETLSAGEAGDLGPEPLRPSAMTPAGPHPDQPQFPPQIGRYRVEGILGKGGFGLVYLARDDQLQRRVAIKVPHRELTSRSVDVEAYLAEARVLARLDHPHILPVLDVGSSDEFPCFFVSKHIDGTSLAQRMRQSRLPYTEAAKLTATVAEALHHAHTQGLVHRDIKPGNILLDREGQPYVVDFGLALKEADVGKGARYAGTPAYMSPEQARGEGHRVDGRSDIYSLGAVLYELLTGRRAFTSDTQEELLDLIATQDPKPPRQIDDRIPKELERICLKAISRRASDRYTTAKDLAEDLRHFLASREAVSSAEPHPTDAKQPAAADTATPRGDSATAGSDSRPLRIVPKGLRSFDEHDADFFLELLPGPRDREGLPDSIRFWRARIEETDPDKTFSVGLIYGPSGCGKSSLVKAGLLPRLAPDVMPVYVEATAQETELRLLNALRRRCPALPAEFDLKQTLTALRRGQGLPPSAKVLIVLDQFEQWLHAQRDEEGSDLVHALRQCDGCHVQCLVLVRDDFWMAATRFMRDLEIRLLEGNNSAAVDLFPVRHAQKVLAAFGRAFGALPDKPNETTAEQTQFIQQATADLAEDGKVICVRLALFAEMMKSQPWVPGVLKQVGGAEGVGVTFLEETFGASTSPPEHRYHQPAARAVLKALLPEAGTNLRGHTRSHDELFQASGYANRPQDFDALLTILDSELRLITPTDPATVDASEVPRPPGEIPNVFPLPLGEGRGEGAKHYQLTHDYLVPSLRDWLTRKQKETRRGRAELRLAERATQWNAKPDKRYLPAWWEYLTIVSLTSRNQWTEPQRHMMRRAGRVLGVRWGIALLIVLVIGIAVQYIVSSVRLRNLRERIQTAVAAMGNSRGIIVPRAIADLKELPQDMLLDGLRGRFAESPEGEKLALAYALAAFGEVPVEFLASQVREAAPQEVENLLAAFSPARKEAIHALTVTAGKSEGDWRHRARLAILALHLGDRAPAQAACRLQPDPIQRTVFIAEFPSWHGDLAELAERAAKMDDPGLRSALCLGIGGIPPERLTREVRQTWESLLANWFARQPDKGTHSAAGWALRKWQRPLPEIAPSRQPAKGLEWHVNSLGMTMLAIAPGEFIRKDDSGAKSSQPAVTVTQAFLISDREVSIGMYRQFLDDPNCPEPEKPQERPDLIGELTPTNLHSVHNVNWYDAVLFCNWLSRKEGLQACYERTGTKEKDSEPSDAWRVHPAANGYRLPTEAEWEYACRAGTTTAYACGDDESLLEAYAVVRANRAEACGSKLPNGWGLFDMHGNVSEWCADAISPSDDAKGSTGATLRADRGGSWLHVAASCRSALRNAYSPTDRYLIVGFRVVAVPSPR